MRYFSNSTSPIFVSRAGFHSLDSATYRGALARVLARKLAWVFELKKSQQDLRESITQALRSGPEELEFWLFGDPKIDRFDGLSRDITNAEIRVVIGLWLWLRRQTTVRADGGGWTWLDCSEKSNRTVHSSSYYMCNLNAGRSLVLVDIGNSTISPAEVNTTDVKKGVTQ